MEGKRHLSFFFACTIALTILLGSVAHATPPYPLPWENEHSVRATLAQQEGQIVACKATVAKIAARNNPPYFVLRDELRANNEPESRIVVMCRPPLNSTGAVRVTGMLGRLPNNEPCITNPTVEGLFDQQGQPIYWTPFPEFFAAGNWQELAIPTGPIPPSDGSLVAGDNGMGISGEVTAYPAEGVSRYDTVASLLASSPALLSRVEIAAKPILSVNALEGYIIAGDDTTDAAVKIFTNRAGIKTTDRLIKATGVVHSENGGQLCLYSGNGVYPFYDSQGADAVSGVTVAESWLGSVRWHSERHDPQRSSSCWTEV